MLLCIPHLLRFRADKMPVATGRNMREGGHLAAGFYPQTTDENVPTSGWCSDKKKEMRIKNSIFQLPCLTPSLSPLLSTLSHISTRHRPLPQANLSSPPPTPTTTVMAQNQVNLLCEDLLACGLPAAGVKKDCCCCEVVSIGVSLVPEPKNAGRVRVGSHTKQIVCVSAPLSPSPSDSKARQRLVRLALAGLWWCPGGVGIVTPFSVSSRHISPD